MNNTQQKKMILFLLPIVLIVGGISIYHGYSQALNFSASGIVVEARWNTSNHGLSLFMIRNGTDKLKKFQSTNVTLNENQIKVGDSFVKKSGSKICLINNVEVQCLK